MKKQVFTALALATMIGATSTGAVAASVQPLPEVMPVIGNDTIMPAGDGGLIILAPKSVKSGYAAMPAAMEAQIYQEKATLLERTKLYLLKLVP